MKNEATSPKKLYRSRSDRYISGVCGGLGSYFNLDSNLIRVLFILSVFVGGSGLILYLTGLIIIPQNPSEEETTGHRVNAGYIWGIVFVLIGSLLLLKQLGWYYNFHFWYIPWTFIWAGLLIAAGLYLIFGYRKNPGEKSATEEKPKSEHRIFRSRDDRMLAGICGGIGREFDIDSSLVRLAWVILTLFTGGIGLLIYIITIFVLPEEPLQNSTS